MTDPDTFIAAVEEMRYWQRRFFRAKQGSDDKTAAVMRAKQLEKTVDEMLAERRTSQAQATGDKLL